MGLEAIGLCPLQPLRYVTLRDAATGAWSLVDTFYLPLNKLKIRGKSRPSTVREVILCDNYRSIFCSIFC
jgi:hypothetical protein